MFKPLNGSIKSKPFKFIYGNQSSNTVPREKKEEENVKRELWGKRIYLCFSVYLYFKRRDLSTIY